MTASNLEMFVGNACYNLVMEILREYRGKGFDADVEEDVANIRKVNSLSYVLTELSDVRGGQLRVEVDSLTRFHGGLKIAR